MASPAAKAATSHSDKVGMVGITTISKLAESLAVPLAGLTSPPPLTVTELTITPVAVDDTFTITVIGG